MIFADELDVGCESQRGMKMNCKVFSMKKRKVCQLTLHTEDYSKNWFGKVQQFDIRHTKRGGETHLNRGAMLATPTGEKFGLER